MNIIYLEDEIFTNAKVSFCIKRIQRDFKAHNTDDCVMCQFNKHKKYYESQSYVDEDIDYYFREIRMRRYTMNKKYLKKSRKASS